MKVLVIQFPGSHGCDDIAFAYRTAIGAEVQTVWHELNTFPTADLYVIPGGAAFANHLRPGALARTSPAGPKIRRLAREKRVLGIGNGAQILCELEVLLGVFLVNESLRFERREVRIQIEQSCCKLTPPPTEKGSLVLPVASGYARYYADFRTLQEIEEKQLVAFRHCNEIGVRDDRSAFAGSVQSIAGLTNFNGNVLGVMFHPERMIGEEFGGSDGIAILRSALGL